MTLQSFYNEIQGDYQGTLSRLLTDARITKYILKFADAKDYDDLLSAMADKRYEDAFRFSHNIKGVCLNLGFTRLATSGSELCETMRNGPPTVDTAPLLEAVKVDYAATMSAIRRFRAEL